MAPDSSEPRAMSRPHPAPDLPAGAAPTAPPPPDTAALTIKWADYPALFQVADATSVAGRVRHMRLALLELVLVIGGATLGGIGSLVPPAQQSAFLLLTVGPFIGALAVRFLTHRRADDHDWFNGRAVAETVKTLTWRYMMRVPPFADDATCDRVFSGQLVAVLRERASLRQALHALPEQPRQITPRMRQVRTLPCADRRDVYVRLRLADQERWYRRKAEANAASATRWFWATVLAQVLAVVMGVARLLVPDVNLMGVFAALAATFTAWTQLGRHEELAKSYALAYQELLLIRGLAEQATTEDELRNAVDDGEGAISREHTMWMAKRGDPLPTQDAY